MLSAENFCRSVTCPNGFTRSDTPSSLAARAMFSLSGPSPTTTRYMLLRFAEARIDTSCAVALRETRRPTVVITNAFSGMPNVAQVSANTRRRTRDAQRHQLDRTLHSIDARNVMRGVAGLRHYGVRARQHVADRRAQKAMPMRRSGLRRIEQIATVHRQYVRYSEPARQPVAERAGRHREVRVDDVERLAAAEFHTLEPAHR